MDTSLNKLVEFYLNNTINLCPLSPLITAFHTHKMAIASWPQTLWRHFALCMYTQCCSLICQVCRTHTMAERLVRYYKATKNTAKMSKITVDFEKMGKSRRSILIVIQCFQSHCLAALWMQNKTTTRSKLKWRHRIYGYDGYFCGYNMASCVELRGEDLSCLNYIQSVGSWKCLYDQYLANKAHFSNITVKTFLRVLPTRWRRKPAGIEITSLPPYV